MRKQSKEFKEFLSATGDQCRQLRVQKDLTLRKMAERADINEDHHGRFEKGKRNVSLWHMFNVTASMGRKLYLLQLLPHETIEIISNNNKS